MRSTSGLLAMAALVGLASGLGCADALGGGAGGADAGQEDCPGFACAGDQVCRYGLCIEPPAACAADADCAGDAYCDEPYAECLPFGVGPGGMKDDGCVRESVAG